MEIKNKSDKKNFLNKKRNKTNSTNSSNTKHNNNTNKDDDSDDFILHTDKYINSKEENNNTNNNTDKTDNNDNQHLLSLEEQTDNPITLNPNTLYDKESTFESIGVCTELCETLAKLKYKHPTKIQKETIEYVLKGNDVIGVAETGSGKTAAFSIPILQNLLKKPQPFYSLIITPTRDLALQISQHIEAIGSGIGVETCVLVGGLDSFSQAMALSRKPHIIVGTPGQICYHLTNTNKFSLSNLKYLVFDEADKLLINPDFERDINKILSCLPEDRTTLLFSATLNAKVENLKQASLKNPVKVQVSSSFRTVDTLVQNYMFLPLKYKEVYLANLLNTFNSGSIIVFVETCLDSIKICFMLNQLGFTKAIALSGKMSQSNRIGALNKFKSGEKTILVATDVANRGLDISGVELVINYDMPNQVEDYIHRVGRTARAGRSGRSITIVTQYDVETLQKIEHHIGKVLEEYKMDEKKVLLLHEKVLEARRSAQNKIKEEAKKLKTSDFYDTNADNAEDEGNNFDNLLGVKKSFNKSKLNLENKSKSHKSFVKKRKKGY